MRRSLLFAFLALAACSHSAGFRERLLATIPEGVDVFVPPAFSPNGQAVAYVAQSDDGSRVIRGGWTSRRLDSI